MKAPALNLYFFLGLVLLVFTSPKLEAQSYIPMLAERTEWHLTSCNNGCLTDKFYTRKDTLYNGFHYNILDGFHYQSGAFWLREDSLDQKVYIALWLNSRTPEEYLLYDFALEAGDSILMQNPISPFPANNGYYRCDSVVGRTLLDGLVHRHYYFSASSGNTTIEQPIWVEGIGSLTMVNAPGGSPSYQGAGQYSCVFKENSGLIYQKLDSISACIPRYIGSEEIPKSQIINLAGLIVGDQLTLSGLPSGTYRYELQNLAGQNLLGGRAELNNGSSLVSDLSSLGTGLYQMVVEDLQEPKLYYLMLLKE